MLEQRSLFCATPLSTSRIGPAVACDCGYRQTCWTWPGADDMLLLRSRAGPRRQGPMRHKAPCGIQRAGYQDRAGDAPPRYTVPAIAPDGPVANTGDVRGCSSDSVILTGAGISASSRLPDGQQLARLAFR